MAVLSGGEPEVVVPDVKAMGRTGVLEFAEGVEEILIAGLSGPTDSPVGFLVQVVVAAGQGLQGITPDVNFAPGKPPEIGIGRWTDILKTDQEHFALPGPFPHLQEQPERGSDVEFIQFIQMDDLSRRAGESVRIGRVTPWRSQVRRTLFYSVGQPVGEGMVAASAHAEQDQTLLPCGACDEVQGSSEDRVSGGLHVPKLCCGWMPARCGERIFEDGDVVV